MSAVDEAREALIETAFNNGNERDSVAYRADALIAAVRAEREREPLDAIRHWVKTRVAHPWNEHSGFFSGDFRAGYDTALEEVRAALGEEQP